MKSPNFVFNVLVEISEGHCVAYCLEMGLVATHDRDDLDELLAKMSKLVTRQLEFAIENDNMSDILHPAPVEIWQRFRDAEQEEAAKETSAKHKQMGDKSVFFEQRAYVACPA